MARGKYCEALEWARLMGLSAKCIQAAQQALQQAQETDWNDEETYSDDDSEEKEERTINDPLPPNSKKPTQADLHAPDPAAEGEHTVVGKRTDPKKLPEPYTQGITYDENGNPVGRIDVTDHGRGDHDNPHWHPFDPNKPNPFDPSNPGNFGPAESMPY